MSDAFIGEIRLLPYTYAPFQWAYCNGQLLPIAQNTALFAVIGNTFGGDARTTVGLPNLKGRTAMGAGNGPGLTPRTLGEAGGLDTVPLTLATMPQHNHTAKAVQATATTNTPTSTSYVGLARDPADRSPVLSFAPAAGGDQPMAPEALAEAGRSMSHENRQPALAVNFCIALDGIFPQRN